jgi:hypothetical protein
MDAAKPPILLWNNYISIFGLYVAMLGVILLVTFGLFSVVSPSANPYVDIVGYLALPGILVAGLVIVPLGMLLKRWRLRRRDPTQRTTARLPHVDLNDPRQLRAAKVFLGSTVMILPVVGVSGYHGYHYTDSSEFCAKVCHSVMEPEATAYAFSSHARVTCAECHIGSGASWFVKSKVSGLRQVLATWRESYSRPIPPAISELRPARETCEQCHWPQKFYGAQLKRIPHFASDESNTQRDVVMLLHTGGGDSVHGMAEGIHNHTSIGVRIEYIATDERLQDIPWLKLTDRSGNEHIYRSDGRPSSDPRPEGQLRKLDCMDCHNRPAHKFPVPQSGVNSAIRAGWIDDRLPFVKREAIRALVQPYPDRATAEERIGASIAAYYREQHPQVWSDDISLVNRTIDAVRDIYNRSFFPYMRVDWRTYPDNIGHMYTPGCFRCHDGQHVNERGEKIGHACNLCHAFLNPTGTGETVHLEEGSFNHPWPLEGVHASINCYRCHDGGVAPDPTCVGCHSDVTEFRAGRTPALAGFGISPDPMFDTVDCASCHDVSQPQTIEALDGACMMCHDDEPERYEGLLSRWNNEIGGLRKVARRKVAERGHAALEALDRAGPLHNFDASRKILRAIIDDPTSGEQPPTPSDQVATPVGEDTTPVEGPDSGEAPD